MWWSSARVWRRRKAKAISQSARWQTISAGDHLPGAGGSADLSAPIIWSLLAISCEVEERMASRGRPSRYLAYGLSSVIEKNPWEFAVLSSQLSRGHRS